jgi:predicted nuclease of predicted toxin-antitoxin system
MQFKLDECLPGEYAAIIRNRGFNTVTVREQRAGGASDDDLLALCRGENRVLVTVDLGIANVIEYPPYAYAGVVVLRPRDYSRVDFTRAITALLDFVSSQSPAFSITGKLAIVNPDLRVRLFSG